MLATPSCPELKRGASSAWSHTNGSHRRVRVDPSPRQVSAGRNGEDDDAVLILPVVWTEAVRTAVTTSGTEPRRMSARQHAQKTICG